MWPVAVEWQELRFGVEIEFVEGDPKAVELLPGWTMAFNERQIDDTGRESGGELKPPPMRWLDREQIREMLARLRATGAQANWSCGLHVHVGLEPWGEAIVLPLLEAALSCQGALQVLLETTEGRLIYCPPVTPEMRRHFATTPTRSVLVHRGRPQSHRCGINTAAWFDLGTVEIRYANGSVDYHEVAHTVELCLRLVAAVGAGHTLPGDAAELVTALGAPVQGYPPPAPAPQWYRERMWMEDALIPVLGPLTQSEVPNGEILHIRPSAEGLVVAVERPGGDLSKFLVFPTSAGWELTPR